MFHVKITCYNLVICKFVHLNRQKHIKIRNKYIEKRNHKCQQQQSKNKRKNNQQKPNDR